MVPLVFDADAALVRAFGVHQMPAIVLSGADGRRVRLLGPDDRALSEAVGALTTPARIPGAGAHRAPAHDENHPACNL